MDSYHALALRYCANKELPYDFDTTFFIMGKGKEVSKVDFAQFCQITGNMEFTTHMARKVFASWVTSQKSCRNMDSPPRTLTISFGPL